MGSHPYFYFTPYQPDINHALQALRQQEFEAGRYDPAINMSDPALWMFTFTFPPTAESFAPGAQHASIEEAIEDADASGTGSILDIQSISDSPAFLASWPLSTEEASALFGTAQPTHAMVEETLILEGELEHWEETDYDIDTQFWDTIGRGQSRYVIIYEGDRPSEIFFVGYSVD
jgi:hypothetical protein